MLFNIFPLVALAGTALAACPISIEIASTDAHIAQVAVTNTGSETITVFKGNTVFSEHATMDLVLSSNGAELPFEGVYVNYKKTGLDASAFITILAGETVTADVNAAASYKLSGIETAEVTAIQGFKYSVGATAPTALKETTFCDGITSNTVTITPDQSKVADAHISKRDSSPFNSRIKKRAVSYSGCTTAQTTSLKTSVSHAISMSSAAYTAAGSAADYFTTWFISTSEESKVRTIYTDVTGVATTAPTIYCTDVYSDCTDGTALLYTIPSDNAIVPCPSNGFWGFPEYATTCADDDYDRAGSILHEITHLYGTDDWAYGSTAARKLTAAHAAANADTYEMYAGSVRLGGCSS